MFFFGLTSLILLSPLLAANHANSQQIQPGSGPADGGVRQRHREGVQGLRRLRPHLHIDPPPSASTCPSSLCRTLPFLRLQQRFFFLSSQCFFVSSLPSLLHTSLHSSSADAIQRELSFFSALMLSNCLILTQKLWGQMFVDKLEVYTNLFSVFLLILTVRLCQNRMIRN